jgi:hypothetical protein
MSFIDVGVFQDFFGRKHNADLPLSNSLDDAAYKELTGRYTANISEKWGTGSLPTEKGFEEWLRKQLKEVSSGK